MKITFHSEFDTQLYPLTLIESGLDILFGALTLRERLVSVFGVGEVEVLVSEGDFHQTNEPDCIQLRGVFGGSPQALKQLINLKEGTGLTVNGVVLAKRGCVVEEQPWEEISWIQNPQDLFLQNGAALHSDLKWGFWKECAVSETNTRIGSNPIMARGRFQAEAVVFNTTNGPIILEDGVEVMEGSCLRGPLYLGKNAQVKMGAKIYGPSSFGEEVRVGGEVNNVVFQPFSNKGHDGFLGNSVLGRWCNLGADTNCSNLKNNYSKVSLYNYASGKVEQTDMQFCGLIMGDHSKAAINSVFNTATVVGAFANIFEPGFPPKFIRSFSWGNNQTDFDLSKALQMAENMMSRRGKKLTEVQKKRIFNLFEQRHTN